MLERQIYGEKEGRTEIFHLLVLFPNGCNTCGWPGRSLDPGTPFRPAVDAGASSVAFPDPYGAGAVAAGLP